MEGVVEVGQDAFQICLIMYITLFSFHNNLGCESDHPHFSDEKNRGSETLSDLRGHKASRC